jgi:epoxyqueuosine reductase
MPPSPTELSQFTKSEADRLGFHLCGVSGPLGRGRTEFHEWWVDQGFGGGMVFLKQQKKRRRSLDEILPGAKSVVVCALRFPGQAGGGEAPPDANERAYGKIARYALHEDYHARLLPKLEALAAAIDKAAGTEGSLAYVDTGAISERAYALQAGLGWIGRNSMLIHPEEGSWFWLGEVVTKAELAADAPVADHCGKCRRCVDACPTGAILEDLRAVDSRKCLSYWNIEHRGPIPGELHRPMGDWLLGCDICQEVCPWNSHSARRARAAEGLPPVEYIPLEEILALTPENFRALYKSRALSRAKLEGLKRNAAIILENTRKRER